MFSHKRALLYAFQLAVLLEPISGWRGFGGRHSYPKSVGLSGGGHRLRGRPGRGHGYPPSSVGPRLGSSHGYPPSGGLSGGGTYSGSYPSSGAKPGNPSSGGNHAYPPSGSGLSGNNPAGQHATNVHNPPQKIAYSPVHGGAPVHYPVYHGTPPTYVYQYKDSGSKYGTLLAGLALLNLGTLGVATYAATRDSSSRTQYTPQPGEVCKFAVQKDNGDYEETKIDCQIISSFILQDQAQARTTGTNGLVPPTANVLYATLPNGTLVPVNVTGVPGIPGIPGSPLNVAQNGFVNSSVAMTNTTLVNALDVKGKAVEVTPGMQCFVMRNSPIHNMRKHVPCGLLQTYADKSIQRQNLAARNVSSGTINSSYYFSFLCTLLSKYVFHSV